MFFHRLILTLTQVEVHDHGSHGPLPTLCPTVPLTFDSPCSLPPFREDLQKNVSVHIPSPFSI